MRHVAAEVTEPRVAEQGVEVRAVDVDLTARVVHRLRDVEHIVLVHAVGRRVRDHQRRQSRGVLRDLRTQVVEVDVAGLVARHDDDAHPGEHGRCRVRAVRRRRDQADVAPQVTAGAVVTADREEPGEFALRPGVRLQRYGVVARHLGEPRLELFDQPEVAAHVRLGRERMHPRELGPRHGGHLGRRVELHGARPERDHPPVEPVVAIRERLQVPHHGGLAAVRVEDRMREVLALAEQTDREGADRIARRFPRPDVGRPALADRMLGRAGARDGILGQAEGPRDGIEIGGGRGLVDRDPDGRLVDPQQLVTTRPGALDHATGVAGHEDAERVEELLRREVQPIAPQGGGQRCRLARDIRCDRAQPLGPVIHGVHRRHDREQHLRRADVRGRLLTTDVLLTRLQCQTIGGVPRGIAGDADEAPRQLPRQALTQGEVARVRPAVAERNSEALRRSCRDVGAE